MPRHHSTWDILAILYWPPSQRIDLETAAQRMRLTAPARRAHSLHKRDQRGIPWWDTALRITAAVVLLALPNRSIAIVGCALMTSAAGALLYSTVRTNSARYFAARRMREHNLVRKAPAEIAALMPVNLRESELQVRRDQALDLLRVLPSVRMLAAYALDNILLRFALLALLPAYALRQALTIWKVPGTQPIFNATLIGFGAVLVVSLWSLTRLKSRARRALKHSLCPDCGYSLANIPSTPSPLQPTLNLGPKRCPECGSLWPLIPFTLDARPLNSQSLIGRRYT